MSISIQTLVWKSALCGNSMLIMQAVADVADDDGWAYPSVAYIAWKTGLARSTVQAILSAFRQEKLLLQQTAGDGSQTSRYRIATENLPEKEPWVRLKGRVAGQSGREVRPSPIIGHGVAYPARNTDAPCPIQQATLPEMLERN
ncbi:MAG: helix-turn-helix domain-containing protein, partial [Candidatus Acidiferrales bacterium]